VPPGARVLDVGAGTGNVAAAASAAGAGEVVAAEPEPALVAAGRARLPGVEWVEAPASRLPFPDAAFDRVLSAFAAIFDPDHEATAAELARVCAPGGAIALTAWIPEGPLAAVAGLLRRGAPPPPGGARSPIGWADEAYARAPRAARPRGRGLARDARVRGRVGRGARRRGGARHARVGRGSRAPRRRLAGAARRADRRPGRRQRGDRRQLPRDQRLRADRRPAARVVA
jgi:SAM-dependent methyltransferase